MLNISRLLGVLALSGAALLAQTTGKQTAGQAAIAQTVKAASPDSAEGPDARPDAGQAPILNVLTVIGNSVLGLPCLDCLLNILAPDLALPRPIGKVLEGSAYQIDSFLIDNTYNGPCTFTLAVKDSHNNIVASATQTLNETAGREILLSTPITIPATAGIGLGSVSNTAVCGTNTSVSKSPVTLVCVNNPPFCVD